MALHVIQISFVISQLIACAVMPWPEVPLAIAFVLSLISSRKMCMSGTVLLLSSLEILDPVLATEMLMILILSLG